MSQRLELPGPILDARVVPVARGLDGDTAVAVSDALVSGGIPLIEVTIEGANGFVAIESATALCHVGAGSVTTASEANNAIDAGAQFLVSPTLAVDVLEAGRNRDTPVILGAFSPTEVKAAPRRESWRVRAYDR